MQGKVEHLLNWTSSTETDGENVALANLVRIIGDGTASVRQRLKAAGAILGYRVQDDSVIEFTKRFLQSVCVSAANIDDRIEASELLRKHEAPRVTPESVRPSYSGDREGSEAERREAWRNYKIRQRHWDVALNLRDVPHWSEWAFDLYSDDFVSPAEGWPPWG